MNEPLTITCCCKDERCGMTLTVLPILQYFKLTITPRKDDPEREPAVEWIQPAKFIKLTMTPRKDDPEREPAVEWIQPAKFIRRMEREGCATFGVFFVRHYYDDDLDLDMQITEDDRQRLLAMAKGEQVTA